MIQHKTMAKSIGVILLLAARVMAVDADVNILKNSGSLDRLFKKSGVYNTSSSGKTPNFVVDPSWPQPYQITGWWAR